MIELAAQDRRGREGRLYALLGKGLAHVKRRIYQQDRGRVLINEEADDVDDALRLCGLGAEHADDRLGLDVAEAVHRLFQVRRSRRHPLARLGRCPAGNEPVLVGPFRHLEPVAGLERVEEVIPEALGPLTHTKSFMNLLLCSTFIQAMISSCMMTSISAAVFPSQRTAQRAGTFISLVFSSIAALSASS